MSTEQARSLQKRLPRHEALVLPRQLRYTTILSIGAVDRIPGDLHLLAGKNLVVLCMQDLRPYQLLGSYHGEVCTQAEYDDNKIYEWRRGDNIRDDKTKTLWEDAGEGTCCLADKRLKPPCLLPFL